MIKSILTLALNPAIDQTIVLDHLQPGAVNRATAAHVNAGGKGVNVASCLADWGMVVHLMALLGDENCEPFRRLFRDKGITDHSIRFAGAKTRINIKIADQGSGETTDINLPGFGMTAERMKEHEGRLLESMGWLLDTWPSGITPLVVASGSLPEGFNPAIYSVMAADVRRRGGRLILDTSGEPLAAALAAPADSLPMCIKPNLAELEHWAGRSLLSRDEILAAARALNRRGIALVVVSLGAEGALYVSSSVAVRAALPPVRPLSTVGAGDAMVAGVAAALWEGANPDLAVGLERIARLSTAFAVGKLEQLGPNLPPRATIEALAATVAIEVCA